MPEVRSAQLGPSSRPVALPTDFDVPSVTKVSGIVELPAHIHWSGPRRSWDLNDRKQRAQVYEMVLTEGTDDDVLRFIDLDELIRLWPNLYLSPHVRQAWVEHLRRLRGIDIDC